jgi:hypothetical protein
VRNHQKMGDLAERAARQQERQAGGEAAQSGGRRVTTWPCSTLLPAHHRADK